MREVTWDQAFDSASHSFAKLVAQEVALIDAIDRYAAEDVLSLCDLPAFETSSMDGWAVSGDGPWKLIGEVLTGKVSSDVLQGGQALFGSLGWQ